MHELVGQDVICVGSDNYYIAEGFGCEADGSDDELPALEQPAVEQLADVFSLDVPDPYTQGRHADDDRGGSRRAASGGRPRGHPLSRHGPVRTGSNLTERRTGCSKSAWSTRG